MKLPRNCQIWLPGYLRERMRRTNHPPAKRVWLTFADHYEPLWNHVDESTGARRVASWAREWPRIAAEFRDSADRMPVYTFFYPEEEYRPALMEPLERMVHNGIADVEIHLHHDGEGEQNFIDRISQFAEVLMNRHGLLRKVDGKAVFGFIHGNWALDNSHPDGRYCGLNNELTLLKQLGCYADFTLPSAPHPMQTKMVNTVYWAVDNPEQAKSHDSGIRAEESPTPPPGALMMIPGPLGIRWGNGRLLPRIERGELAGNDLATQSRARIWLAVAPRIGADIFIKLFTHGTQERNSAPLLSAGLRDCIRFTRQETRENGQELYFASAWQMKHAIDAALKGDDPVKAVTQARKTAVTH